VAIITQLKGILNQFLKVLPWIAVSVVTSNRLDELPTSSRVGQKRVGGVDVNKPRMCAVIETVMGLAASPPPQIHLCGTDRTGTPIHWKQ